MLRKMLPKKLLGEAAMKAIANRVQSQDFIKKYQVSRYLDNFGWIYLHVWMISHRLNNDPNVTLWSLPKNQIFKWGLWQLFEQQLRQHVYLYDDHFNMDVYSELYRRKILYTLALDDYYQHGFKQKPFPQILQEDLELECPSELVEKYLTENIKSLKTAPLNKIIEGEFNWCDSEVETSKTSFKQPQITSKPSI